VVEPANPVGAAPALGAPGSAGSPRNIPDIPSSPPLASQPMPRRSTDTICGFDH
jgi:hypothetical protein